MDDVGASSKEFEQYGRGLGPLSNFLFIKRLPPFKKWGPYREITAQEWKEILTLLEKYSAVMTVAITAGWVNADGTITPFVEKWNEQAIVLRDGLKRGLVEIANHGLTHCVLKDRAFLPKCFSGNRQYHREFWGWLAPEIHHEHLRRSQEILRNFFGSEVTTLVPPGNVFSDVTLDGLEAVGLMRLNCNIKQKIKNPRIIPNDYVDAFHDKDIVENGVQWLEEKLKVYVSQNAKFIRINQL